MIEVYKLGEIRVFFCFRKMEDFREYRWIVLDFVGGCFFVGGIRVI